MLDLSNEPDLGYIFYPSDIPHYPGHPRLDVVITEQPTKRHFDPQQARFQVVNPVGRIEQMTVHHPWPFGKKYRVCAGRIYIRDRVPKTVEAFSFGGELQILSTNEQTVCALTSPVPILDLVGTHNLSMWFTAEVEILLAQQNATQNLQQPEEFGTCLANVEPLVLYASCLQTLHDKKWPVHENEYLEGQHFVQSEIKRLKETSMWLMPVPSLDQLFS